MNISSLPPTYLQKAKIYPIFYVIQDWPVSTLILVSGLRYPPLWILKLEEVCISKLKEEEKLFSSLKFLLSLNLFTSLFLNISLIRRYGPLRRPTSSSTGGLRPLAKAKKELITVFKSHFKRLESRFVWNSQFELICHEIHFDNVKLQFVMDQTTQEKNVGAKFEFLQKFFFFNFSAEIGFFGLTWRVTLL